MDSHETCEEEKDNRKQFGARLRQLRLQANLEENDVVHLTRISPSFIAYIESGQFDKLPGKVFARGFVRNICKVLDIDSSDILEELEDCWQDDNSHQLRPAKKGLFFVKSKKMNPSGWMNFFSIPTLLLRIGPPIFLSVCIGVGFYLYKAKPENQPLPQEKIVEESVEAKAVLNSQPLETKAAVKDSPPKEVVQKPSVVALGKIGSKYKLELELTGNQKVRYQIDSGKSITQEGQTGFFSFHFAEKVDFYFSDASLVKITFMNQLLENLGKSGESRKLSFHGAEKESRNF